MVSRECRAFPHAVSLAGAILALVCQAEVAVAQEMFRGDIVHSGVYQSQPIQQKPMVKWAFKTSGPIFSSPALSGGILYFGGADNFLYALDRADGKEKWKFQTGGPVNSSPAVFSGVVFVNSYDAFYAISAEKGVLKWKFPIDGERKFEAKHLHGSFPPDQTHQDPWDVFLSSPSIINRTVYFGSGNGNVYALDIDTGRLKWKFHTGDVVHASPAIANGMVYIGSWDSYFYALDAATGEQKWRFKAGEDPEYHNQVGFQSSATVVEGVIYVGCRDGHVYALDALTGKKKWEYSTDQSWVNGTPLVHGGRVYVGTCDTKLFLVLDASTGSLISKSDARACVVSSPSLAGDMVYFGTHNGQLRAIDTAGKQLWKFETDGAKKNAPNLLNPDETYTNQRFFYDSEDVFINVYRRFQLGSILSSPTLSDGRLYVGSTDGYLYALE